MNHSLVLNEREARAAKAELERIELQLSPSASIESARHGLNVVVWQTFQKSLTLQRKELSAALRSYELAKSGNSAALKEIAADDPGLSLVVARISKGLSQKELARRVGLKEQQIQRYEADRYRAISLANYSRIARAVGLSLRPVFSNVNRFWFGEEVIEQYSADVIKKVVKHGRERGWFSDQFLPEESSLRLSEYVSEAYHRFGSPALFRTGISVENLEDDFSLIAWRARVTKLAVERKQSLEFGFDPLDIGWLEKLVQLSVYNDGPARARELIEQKGIIFIVEPQISGLKLDGAAFIVEGTPVIALTIRYDRIDNFWFTLLHELAHVYLHLKNGLSAGFFDDLDLHSVDELEDEANIFSSNVIVSDEIWRRSPARISKVDKPFEDLAKKLNINSALLFGRARRERNNYKIFADRIGQGNVRVHLTSSG